jgi:hypothetical protein
MSEEIEPVAMIVSPQEVVLDSHGKPAALAVHVDQIGEDNDGDIYFSHGDTDIPVDPVEGTEGRSFTVNWGQNKWEREHPDVKPDFSYLTGINPIDPQNN